MPRPSAYWRASSPKLSSPIRAMTQQRSSLSWKPWGRSPSSRRVGTGSSHARMTAPCPSSATNAASTASSSPAASAHATAEPLRPSAPAPLSYAPGSDSSYMWNPHSTTSAIVFCLIYWERGRWLQVHLQVTELLVELSLINGCGGGGATTTQPPPVTSIARQCRRRSSRAFRVPLWVRLETFTGSIMATGSRGDLTGE